MALIQATPERVIAVALSYVGYLEKKSNTQLDDFNANAGSGNYTKFARDLDAIPGFYNGKKQGVAWCDVFVDASFVYAFGAEAAKKLLCQPAKSSGAGCKYSAEYYKAKGRFYTENPQVGDQMFFYNSNKTGVAHTGLIYLVDNLYIYTVEGNTSSQSGVVNNGGGVYKKKYARNYDRIYGYGRPAYENVLYEASEETRSTAGTALAKHFDSAKAGIYQVKPGGTAWLYTGAGRDYPLLQTLPGETPVTCLGHYTDLWLRVETAESLVGFCHSDCLVRGESR